MPKPMRLPCRRCVLTLNGETLSGDVPSMIIDGRTLVPVRLVGEALSAQVLWVQQTGQVILKRGEDLIVLTLDSDSAVVQRRPRLSARWRPRPSGPAIRARTDDDPSPFCLRAAGRGGPLGSGGPTRPISRRTHRRNPRPTRFPPEQSDKLVTDIQADANAQTC